KTQFNPNRHTNFFSQTFWLITRYLSRKLNDLETLAIQICQSPIIAFLVILIFKEVDQIVLFFIVISAIWFGTNNAAKEIVSESSIFKRERMYNQGIIPYLISKIFVLSIIGFIQSAIFILILSEKYKSSAVPLENPTTLIFWMFIITVVSNLFGLTLSAISSTTEKVMGLIPIALIPQIMFSGVMVKMTAVFVKIPSFLMISRWSMTGITRLQTNVFDNILKKKAISLDILKENLGETYDQFNSIQFELYVLCLQFFFFFTLIYLILRDRYSN
ncbi:MAG: ABC transporter permease, partial [Bacteroidetes bacterium]|nr:ABC transporter permease [Bacteroidota bacterium]